MPWPAVDVLVVGAGPAGLGVAWGCTRLGLEVAVVEAAPDARSGVGLTLWPNAEAALRELGAADEVLRNARSLPGMTMRDPSGRYLSRIDTEEMLRDCGGVGRALTRGDILAALTSGLPPDTIRSGIRATCVHQDQSSATVDTDSGPMRARIVVGADGDRSLVRTHLWPDERRRDVDMRVVRGVSDLALEDHPAEVTFGRGVQVGVFAMRAGTYWFAAGPRAALSAENLHAWLGTLTDWHAPIGEVIRSTPPGRLFVTDVWDRVPRRAPWGAGLVTLAGDAAHPSAPTMGQGTGQAFEDAAALLGALARHGVSEQALRLYEQSRSRRAAAAVRTAHVAAVAGLWTSPVVCALRDRAMQLTPHRVEVRRVARLFTASTPSERPAVSI